MILNYGYKQNIGEVNFETGKVKVGDPCYEDGFELRTLTIKKGLYDVFITREDNHNASLVITHKGSHVWENDFRETSLCFGVDSGQGGIFQKEQFANDDTVADLPKMDWNETEHTDFYRAMCHITLKNEEEAGVYEYGCLSSSGYGDGGYDILTATKDGEVVGVALVFISEEEDDEYEEE